MIRGAIFDLDGTLVDSLPGIAAAANQALCVHGYPERSLDEVRGFIGNGSKMLIRRALGGDPSETLVEQVHHEFMPAYKDAWINGTHLYPGIREMLEELHERSMPLAVCSNKPHRFTVEIMEALFDWVPWSMILGQQEHVPRKPDPTGPLQIASTMDRAPAELAFVGDSLVDFETATAAGMQPILVAWGFRPVDELQASSAPVLPSVAHLRRHLRELHPGE